MTNNIDTLRATMAAFGYRAERVEDALRALTAESITTEEQTPPTYLSPKGLCRCLNISTTTLWRLNPPYHRVGGRKRYLLNEVMEHMKRGDQ